MDKDIDMSEFVELIEFAKKQGMYMLANMLFENFDEDNYLACVEVDKCMVALGARETRSLKDIDELIAETKPHLRLVVDSDGD